MFEAKIELTVIEGQCYIQTEGFSMSTYLDIIIRQFGLIFPNIILYGYEDGHHFVVEYGRYKNGDTWFNMTHAELDVLLDEADRGINYTASEYITNRIGI